MKPQAERQNAESLFVRDGKSVEEIAASTGVSLSTLKRWSSSDKWVEKRAQFRQGPTEAIQTLHRERIALIQQIATAPVEAKPGLIDALHKLTQSIQTMEQRTGNLDVTMAVLHRLAEFVGAREKGGIPLLCGQDATSVEIIQDWTRKFLEALRKENS